MTTHFREHEIRPAEMVDEEKRRGTIDTQRLLARRSEFVDVACPACAGQSRTQRFEKDTLSYQECTACRTVYISPRPSPDVLHDYYENSEAYAYWNSVIFPSSEFVRRERIFRPRVLRLLELAKKHALTMGTLLEVGGGFGTFAEELNATKMFDRVMVAEPTPQLAATCRARGLEVIEKRIEDIVLEQPVDVVVSFEVIEHLFDPGAFIASCRQMLRPGGLVVLTCPNIMGFEIEVLGTASPALDAGHLNYFHPRSLGMLFERNGFKVVESLTPGRLDVDIVRNRVLGGDFDLRDPFLRRLVIDEFERLGSPFQDFLSSSGLSSNMWVVARNP
jgi:2-polyprenyl-3-methyl-5-hydroxy-6-metoxy-1,4-benzoquinol methylase